MKNDHARKALTAALSHPMGEGERTAPPQQETSPHPSPPEQSEKNRATMDLAGIRVKLEGGRGQHYWRSLEEVADTKEFREMLHREFPPGASEWLDSLNRRSFLKLAAASLALGGLTACTKQP